MNSQAGIKTLLAQFIGQANFIVVPRFFITMLGGDFNSAILLHQILYWNDRSNQKDKWFYKSSKDWFAEIALSKYQIERATAKLKSLGFIETKLKKANGAPTLHFRAIEDKLFEEVELTLKEIGLYRNSTIQESKETEQSDSKETQQSLTKTSLKITTKNKDAFEIFVMEWNRAFPDKKITARNKSAKAKFTTRSKSLEFQKHWRTALVRAGESPHLQNSGWFTPAWFLKNEENFMRVHAREFTWLDEKMKAEQSKSVEAGKSTGDKIRQRQGKKQ